MSAKVTVSMAAATIKQEAILTRERGLKTKLPIFCSAFVYLLPPTFLIRIVAVVKFAADVVKTNTRRRCEQAGNGGV